MYVKFEDSGCGSVAERSLPTLQFESSHRQNIIKNMCLLLTVEKKKNKEKAGNGTLKNLLNLFDYRSDPVAVHLN